MTHPPTHATHPLQVGATQDEFRYGWRYVKRPQPDGTNEFEQIPLTLYDVLHPQEEDFIVHNADHERFRDYLTDVLLAQTAHDPSAVVLSDVRIAWDVPKLKPHGPDIMVIQGVQERQNWSTFDVAQEGVRPVLVIEITSPETRHIDLGTKVEHYHRAGVAFYAIVDLHERKRQVIRRVLGFRHTPTGFEPLPLNDQGWLWVEPANMWLGFQNNDVQCYDEAGQPIGNYVEINAALKAESQARSQAEQRAQAEAQARSQAEQHAQAEAQARSQAEQRAQAAEVQLQELQAEVQRLRQRNKPDHGQ